MMEAATAAPPPPVGAMGPTKAHPQAEFDVPGKYLSFEEKPFTDRLQAMEESRLAALHYSTGLQTTGARQEHQGILLGEEVAPASKPRKFRLGRRRSSSSSGRAVPPPPPADGQSKPWSRKLSIRRRNKEAPQPPPPPAAEASAPGPAATARPASRPPPPPIAEDGAEAAPEPPSPSTAALQALPASPRSRVRQYLEMLGHTVEATEAVILAFTEAEYSPEEWMPELRDMQAGDTLTNFLELCSTALPDLHAKATSLQATWRGFSARQSDPQCKAAVAAMAAHAAYDDVVASYCPSPIVAPTPVAVTAADNEHCDDGFTADEVDMPDLDMDGQGEVEMGVGDTQVVRLSFAFVTASEKLELVLSPSTPGHAARVSREIIEDRRRSSMIAHSVVCDAGNAGRDHVGMCRDEIVVFASDVVKMATSKLSSGSGPIWVNPTWESGEPERVDEC
jgi:hypothetical protein